MPPKKRKIEEDSNNESPKYVAGKVARHGANPPIDYSDPLNPDSELYRDDWSIPRFNLFVTYTLDHLRETYSTIFKDFIKLPSRKFHPQYYYKIDQPISINEIKNRDYEYADGTRNFLLDVELLAKNCASYNEEDSLIVKNSYQMVNYIQFEALKAKNVERNYIINDTIKTRLISLLETLIEATAKKIYDTIPDLKANLQDSENDEFQLSEPFMELVDKEELPEYYEVIHRPNALNIIKTNLENDQYLKIYDFITDVNLVFDNAFVFNSSTALIYQSAKALLEYFTFISSNMFNELKDLKDRGELTLDIEKNEYEKFLGDRKVDERHVIHEESEDDFDDFNHVEGLGNGYTRNILTEDYLLGPDHVESMRSKFSVSNQTPILNEKINKHVETPKFNILKSLKNESVSEQFKKDKKTYELVREVSIFSSKGLYTQGINPMQGSKPSCSQNWLEFNFIGKNLNQNENIFTISVDPIQTFLTVVAKVNNSNLKSALQLNNDTIKPRVENKKHQPTIQQNFNSGSLSTQDEKNENFTDSETHTENFDIRLNEGLNLLEFSCETTNIENGEVENNNVMSKETMKFWINVFP
ncbi:similar to Saccharomyces cerevisiae YKR008W RSC4 Component of the RSC chromatin remodeling complex [Maudiozyma saulgeensis]|uniref:Similar to Saccharomyces cerevisiae YKR008W RSC4 Component of the RSC chromatin remodeling complex n=1 Tax=Maudiozyma saulgeensis TaxID=1789683 RepID=A0A1X7QWN2_9SACH|nr:similar to Saccharomyces cerevisiae YKR008W RSC4 Component of the RSC chromatin remodeling complex [Kazachstania saulgeensis]